MTCPVCGKGYIIEQENKYGKAYSQDGTKGTRFYKFCSNVMCNYQKLRHETSF